MPHCFFFPMHSVHRSAFWYDDSRPSDLSQWRYNGDLSFLMSIYCARKFVDNMRVAPTMGAFKEQHALHEAWLSAIYESDVAGILGLHTF